VASSFDAVPGLPILHSVDLVNWEIIGHVFAQQPPADVFSKTQHGSGAWAPAIRYHEREFYVYWPDPDIGIYMAKAKSARAPGPNRCSSNPPRDGSIRAPCGTTKATHIWSAPSRPADPALRA
jgi:beta-xylosidase